MKSFNEFLEVGSPILFVNFDYDVTDLEGITTNIKNYLEANLNNCYFCKYTDIYWFDDSLFFDNIPIADFGLVFLGAVNQSFEMSATIQSFCTSRKIQLIKYGETPENYNKLLEIQKLSDANINVPKTVIGNPKHLNIEKCIDYLGFPIVSKITNGSQGKGVHINKTEEDLRKRLKSFDNETIILQEFIPNQCDYRIFFIKDDHIVSMRRTRKDDDFKNNISLGGTGEKVTLDSETFDMALNCHNAMGFFASGVDLIQSDDTKEWYCLEVNAAPQFGMWNVDEILDVFIKHILIKNSLFIK
jgi:hypothetical protein